MELYLQSSLSDFYCILTGRRFSCDYCEYSATTSSNLRRHARIHAGARPYLCPHCPHRTSELDALKKHVLDSGRHPGLPLYVCPWCRSESSTVCVGFNASSLAWRHLLSEHSSEIMKPETLSRIGRVSEKSLSEVRACESIFVAEYWSVMEMSILHQNYHSNQPYSYRHIF